MRDVQGKMKKAGQPWEKAKAFDNSCRFPGLFPRRTYWRPAKYNAGPERKRRATPARFSTADMIHKIVLPIAR
ncbi:hypothetical protein ACLK1T_29975 [Escherichia coli]